MSTKLKIISDNIPKGDQPKAIEEIVGNIKAGKKHQMLLGITGSGKTFTVANIIEKTNRPALIMVHNKTLAAQLYLEMKDLFPNNAVEYFVSYYDYYQPEAYISRTDTYIEKDASINKQIDLMRHSATRSLLERDDVIVVSSVSCIYGLGSPEAYYNMTLKLQKNHSYKQDDLLREFIKLQYSRSDIDFDRGTFRVRGDNVDIFPVHLNDKAWKLSFFGDTLDEIVEFDPLTGEKYVKYNEIILYANSHFVTPRHVIEKSMRGIKDELVEREKEFIDGGNLLEASRIVQRTKYDIEMLHTTSMCKGIENYSRYLTGRDAGEPPPTLFEYLPKNALLFIDESHVTVPQIRAMYNGDRVRKTSLVEHGFRLPSALDNRPLKFTEWEELSPQTVFISATPGVYELDKTKGVVTDMIIRPTGLLDPEIIIRPVTGSESGQKSDAIKSNSLNQVEDVTSEIQKTIKDGFRILVTTLTKKMAEDLTSYLKDLKYKVEYLHSNVHTLERIEIIRDLREGNVDIIVGVNLLREGLDIPECALVAILDADKEGFLRSETSLLQTIGRAARNSQGRVILYADKITDSIKKAVKITKNRRLLQQEYNKTHGIIPKTITRKIHALMELQKVESIVNKKEDVQIINDPVRLQKHIAMMQKNMHKAAVDLDFERAAELRDKINLLQHAALEFGG